MSITGIPVRNAAAKLFEAGWSFDAVNDFLNDLNANGNIIKGEYVDIALILDATGNNLSDNL